MAGELVGQFHDHGLLDEVILGVAPVFLGSGAPLLPRRITAPDLELTDVDPLRRDLRHPALRREPAAGLTGILLHLAKSHRQ